MLNIQLTSAGIALVQKGGLGTRGVYMKIILNDGYLTDTQTIVNTIQINNLALNITDLILENDEEGETCCSLRHGEANSY